jgi:hypothetical protein
MVLKRPRTESTSPTKVPASTERLALDAKRVGFSLKADENTLREVDKIHEENIRAAQAIQKFAWR